MNRWKPVIAASVACLLMGVYVVDRSQLQTTRLNAARSARLIPFDVMDATIVELTNESGTFTLKKNAAGVFELTSPIESKADEGQVKALVDNFYGAKINQSFKSNEPESFGFDKPAARIRLEGKLDGKQISKTYELGSKSGSLGRVYIREMDEPSVVMTTNDWVLNQSQKDLTLLRDKTLVAMLPEAVKSFSIKKDSEVLTVSRTDEFDSGFVINSRKPANVEWATRLLRSMESLQAFSVDDHPTTSVAQLGLEPAKMVLTLTPKSGEPVLLNIGNFVPQEDSFYVTSSTFPIVSKVRSRFLREALTPPTQWQSLSFFWRPTNQYEVVEAMSGSSGTLIKKTNGKWMFPDIPDLPVREDFLIQYIELLKNLKGFEYVGEQFTEQEELQTYGIRPESYRVSLKTADGKTEGIALGSLSSDAEFSYIKRLQDSSIWKVSPLEMKGLRVSRKELQDKRIATGFADDVNRIKIKLSTGTEFQLYFDGGNWKFAEPGKQVALIPAADAIGFLDSVESIEWNSELISSNTEKVDIAFEFFNKAGERIHFVNVYETTYSQRLVETPQGFFFVAEEQFTAMLTRFSQIIQVSGKK